MQMELPPPNRARWNQPLATRTLGVVMIVKNEESNLPALFRTIADLADEVVVVDTGSTDGTVAVCTAWGARVVFDPWRGDFSHARNRGIREATAKHLLWLDADDRVPEATRAYLEWLRDEALPRLDDKAFVLEVNNLNAAGEVFDTFLQTRLFPRLPGVEFRYRVHEQIADSLQERGIELVKLEVAIEHTGYRDAELNREKALRNEALLREELRRNPDDLHTLIHVAQTLFALRRFPEAERQLSEALEKVDTSKTAVTFVAELHSLRAVYRLKASDMTGAMEDLERAAQFWPEWGVPYTSLAELHLLHNRTDLAWSLLERARAGSFAPTIFGFPIAQARRNLEFFSGLILRIRGQHERAIACMEKALEIAPRDIEVRIKLGQMLVDAHQYPRALEILQPAGEDEAAIPYFVELASALALARAATGDLDGAGACLVPLLDVFSTQLGGSGDVGPMELASAMLATGHAEAAKNMITLLQETLTAAA